MARPTRTHLSDLRGATRMALDAGAGITDIVERMHRTIQLLPLPLGRHATDSTRGITGFVYRSVRGSMRLISRGLDASLAPAMSLLPDGEPSPQRDALVSAVNGVYGDYLERTGNPLAIEMSLRRRGRAIDPANPADAPRDVASSGKLLVLAHGLCMNDRQWTREGHDHGAALADEFGCTPLYLHYNTGRNIAANGHDFAALLETLVCHWPRPVTELVIIGHSMGGLVARSACHQGRMARHTWLKHLRKLFFVGTPHHGAPLERGGQWLDFAMDLSPYSAPFTRIGKSRSAGITDLRHGTITRGVHEHVPLPAGVKCYALAATLGERRDLLSERLVGDGLVPLKSALGEHRRSMHQLHFPRDRQWIGYGMGHLELLNRPEVYAQLHAWMQEPA